MKMNHDRKLLIAIGRSRKASQWQNKEMLWSEFLDKLATTTRTRETVAEYAALPKGERDTIKDVGGFVGGYLKNGRRNNASVVNRCMLCLDADNADPGLMDDLDMTFINAYALYCYPQSYSGKDAPAAHHSADAHGYAGRVCRSVPPRCR